MANLGQEIAQTSEEEVADTIEVEVDVPLDIDLPEFDEVPGTFCYLLLDSADV